MAGSQLTRQVMTYLRNLLRELLGRLQNSTQSTPTEVFSDEPLSSFAFRSSHIVRKTNTIHHSRLMPRRENGDKKNRLETSVCRAKDLSEEQIWIICSVHFDQFAPSAAIGRGDGPASVVFDADLNLDADGKPYKEHANIVGWHDSSLPDDELKHHWMNKAQGIAAHFKFISR